MYGIELAYLVGKKYGKTRSDLFKRVRGIASVANIPLSHDDIEALEKVLWSELGTKLGTKEEYAQEYGSKPLGELVREIVGLDMNAAKAAFSEYLEGANLDSRRYTL